MSFLFINLTPKEFANKTQNTIYINMSHYMETNMKKNYGTYEVNKEMKKREMEMYTF